VLASTRLAVVTKLPDRVLLHREAFAAIRELKGLSQSELARQIGIRQNHISALERGAKGPAVPISTALALAGALGVPVAAISLAPPPCDQVAS
jgi:transcriptional regulator with XRE-family HTH domain